MHRAQEHGVTANGQCQTDVEHHAEEFRVELQVHEIQEHHEEFDAHQDEQTGQEGGAELFLGVAEHHLNCRDDRKEDRDLDVCEVTESVGFGLVLGVGVDGAAHDVSFLVRPGSGRRG